MKKLVVVVVALSLAACTPVRAWERSKLAHPTMTTTSFAGPGYEHMVAVHEGAVGGNAAVESGCGCN